MYQHQATEQQLGQLPDHQEHQHPQDPQDDRLALGVFGRIVHVLLLAVVRAAKDSYQNR
ncbi:hypothetical protein D3C77_741180 [compost metagenome]